MPMPDDPRAALPLRLTQHSIDSPVLLLGGIDITRFVASDGFKIQYVDIGLGHPVPEVTLVFSAGRLDLDFDVELLEQLLVDARDKAVRS